MTLQDYPKDPPFIIESPGSRTTASDGPRTCSVIVQRPIDPGFKGATDSKGVAVNCTMFVEH